ncbi:GGDEF domain-containing protein [Vibrio sp. 1159]|uniref:GGDEF domain-containing protein n=1 Tax=Vibrio sp. 1159 TaxID=3074545 RepID=UPI0029648B11|nr:GGDEF domain-containing protein [Vibrio sp. 1159]MDW2322722.1 GGDEF domain-containing protein [Vibrio sp. 1159]
MINSTSSLIDFASVINNIVCSVVGCIFLSQVRTGLTGYQRRSALYFFYFFLVFGFAFAAMAIRSWLPLIYSVFFNNFMYMTVAYLLLFGSMSWYKRDIKPWLWKLAITHVCSYTAIQVLIYEYVPNTLELRVQIAFANFALVYISTFLLCHNHRATNGKGERMLALASLVCLFAAGLPTFALAVTGKLEYYRAAVVVTQNIVCFFLLGGLLSLFLFNQIDWHYKRSIQDELTGLFNRRYINERITGLFQNDFPIHGTLALVDIDHFKKVNDRFGHDAGDNALVYVSKILSGCLAKDDLVSRYGGEEFLIFIAGDDSKQALATLNKIHSSVESQSRLSTTSIPITVSIGYSNLNSKDTLQSSFARADSALYMAKNQGRNCIVGE